MLSTVRVTDVGPTSRPLAKYFDSVGLELSSTGAKGA